MSNEGGSAKKPRERHCVRCREFDETDPEYESKGAEYFGTKRSRVCAGTRGKAHCEFWDQAGTRTTYSITDEDMDAELRGYAERAESR